MLFVPLYIFEKYVFLCNFVRFIISLCFLIFLLCTGIFTCGESMNTYLHTYHLTADVSLALIWQVTDDLKIVHCGAYWDFSESLCLLTIL